MILAELSPNDFVRNVLTNASIGTSHPDFIAIYNGFTLFIAEEKPGDDLNGAVSDCLLKFRWLPSFQNLPFFITFAFGFNRCSLVVITRNGHTRIDYSIQTIPQRLSFLRRAITYARVLRHFTTPYGNLVVSIRWQKYQNKFC
jgi:hypothetical protein